MDCPPMVTVPLLLTDSDLKGSNFPASDFSESPSAFLSCGLGAAVAARNAGNASARATPRQAPNLNRFMFVLRRDTYVFSPRSVAGENAKVSSWIPSTLRLAYSEVMHDQSLQIFTRAHWAAP